MYEHKSDCALHNGPALPVGPCDCGASELMQRAFEEASRPLIKFLNDAGHPHMQVIVTTTSAEMVEGVKAFNTNDYL